MPRVAGTEKPPPPRRSASEGPLKLPERPSSGTGWRGRSQSSDYGDVADLRRQQRPWQRRLSAKAVDIGCRGAGPGCSRWTTFSYDRLPQPHIRLSIVRLDGSSFDVQVARSASLEDLKLAVEEIFSGSSGGGQGNVSWSHVWGHFCLCYMNQKLTDDKVLLKAFGVKDGDKLHFIRHLSIHYRAVSHHQRK